MTILVNLGIQNTYTERGIGRYAFVYVNDHAA